MIGKRDKPEEIVSRLRHTRRQAEAALFQYINGYYNPRRRHSTLGRKSPLAFEQKAASMSDGPRTKTRQVQIALPQIMGSRGRTGIRWA